jgi:DNA polymerase-3 subunit epsilon
MSRHLLDFKSLDVAEIHRLKPVDKFSELLGDASTWRLGVVLDIETTGTNHETDQILELCAIPFLFDQQGRIGDVFPAINRLNEPTVPITEEITRITGITAEIVAGHKMSAADVHKLISKASIVVAHNASFDWSFVTAFLIANGCENVPMTPWLCTVEDLRWAENDVGSAKLDYLAFRFGFFFDAHRAEADCRALLAILASVMPDGRTVLSHAFDGLRPALKAIARNSLFSSKDKLKNRGYRWNPKIKSWWKTIRAEDQDAEDEWLKEHAYGGCSDADFVPVEIWKRFAGR